MVGRFVHQQDVGTAQEHAGHRHPHFPAAGERPDIGIDLVGLEPEPVQHLAGLAFERISAQMLVFLLHLAEAREYAVDVPGPGGIRHRVIQRFELVMKLTQASAAGNRLVQHRSPRHFFDVLPEVTDGQPLWHRHVAVVR